jgi:hypothetical protein
MASTISRRAITAGLALLALVAAIGAVTLGVGTAVGVTTGVVNPSFEGTWGSGTPYCWQLGSVGSGSATLSASSTAHSGSRSVKLTVTSLGSSANRKVVMDQQNTACTAPAVGGHTYVVSAYYRSSTAPRMTVYFRDTTGWHYWTRSASFPARSTWGKLTFTTATLPSGATALSFGPGVTETGWVLLDDTAMTDTSTATPMPTPTATATPTPTTTSTATATPTPTPTVGSTVVNVSTAGQLSTALAAATPGQTIVLADGVYVGNFSLKATGTSSAGVRITGSRNAILDGGSVSSGYVLHLDKADYAEVDGISIRNGQKALVVDQSTHTTLTNLDLHTTGEEILLLRNYSSDNTVSNNQVHDSGRSTAGYGEGVYVGLSESNWSSPGQSRTNGGPDTSDRNQILGNHIYGTMAENVDIKEGTTGGLIANNSFDSTGMSGSNYADSWVDIAGNGYTVRNNSGVNPSGALLDGYQTHTILSGWANNNVFMDNVSAVNAAGYGFNIQTPSSGNVVYTSNTVTGATKGVSNLSLTP